MAITFGGVERSDHTRGLADGRTRYERPRSESAASDALETSASSPPPARDSDRRLDRNRQVSVGLSCAHLLLRDETVFPEHWHVDWDDEPSRYKRYASAHTLRLAPCLPVTFDERDTCGSSLTNVPDNSTRQLSGLLAYAAGLIQLRQEVRFATHASGPPSPAAEEPQIGRAVALAPSAMGCFRAVPSGGALYPWELYVCAIDDAAIANGVYHYDLIQHGLTALRTGDVRAALHDATAAPLPACGVVVFVSAVFWKNYFKYGHASVRLHALDAGIVASQLMDLAPIFGFNAQLCFQFLDLRVANLLGSSDETEAVQVGVMLDRPISGDSAERGSVLHVHEEMWGPRQVPRVLQRSRRPKPCPVAIELNRWSVLESLSANTHPSPQAPFVSDWRIAHTVHPLPPAPSEPPAPSRLTHLLRTRASGIDPYRSATLTLSTLGRVCAAALAGYRSDLSEDALLRFVTLSCVVNRVEGIAAGVYRYDAAEHRLICLGEGNREVELQQTYLLNNVNLSAAAVVLYLVGSYEHSIQVHGNRGFRLLNLEAGIVARRAQAEATEAGCGAQAILGFSAPRVAELLFMGGTALSPLLGIALGNPPDHPARIALPLWT